MKTIKLILISVFFLTEVMYGQSNINISNLKFNVSKTKHVIVTGKVSRNNGSILKICKGEIYTFIFNNMEDTLNQKPQDLFICDIPQNLNEELTIRRSNSGYPCWQIMLNEDITEIKLLCLCLDYGGSLPETTNLGLYKHSGYKIVTDSLNNECNQAKAWINSDATNKVYSEIDTIFKGQSEKIGDEAFYDLLKTKLKIYLKDFYDEPNTKNYLIEVKEDNFKTGGIINVYRDPDFKTNVCSFQIEELISYIPTSNNEYEIKIKLTYIDMNKY